MSLFTYIQSLTDASYSTKDANAPDKDNVNSSSEVSTLGGMPISTALNTWAEANAHPMSARPLDDPCSGLPGKVRTHNKKVKRCGILVHLCFKHLQNTFARLLLSLRTVYSCLTIRLLYWCSLHLLFLFLLFLLFWCLRFFRCYQVIFLNGTIALTVILFSRLQSMLLGANLQQA